MNNTPVCEYYMIIALALFSVVLLHGIVAGTLPNVLKRTGKSKKSVENRMIGKSI